MKKVKLKILHFLCSILIYKNIHFSLKLYKRRTKCFFIGIHSIYKTSLKFQVSFILNLVHLQKYFPVHLIDLSAFIIFLIRFHLISLTQIHLMLSSAISQVSLVSKIVPLVKEIKHPNKCSHLSAKVLRRLKSLEN